MQTTAIDGWLQCQLAVVIALLVFVLVLQVLVYATELRILNCPNATNTTLSLPAELGGFMLESFRKRQFT